ncbi:MULTISPECIES: hypothetical protein [Methylobacterium]|uniref:hypothetical protein n=1 Tax=Methylobacterium TaxID=407 RepID=UPI0011CAF389|nr:MULTISPECIES: hypothetical protein [Methylobacterium]TXN47541.1 hypothetical protein FV233_04580 [Methylobacterium sp. WL7]
MATVSPNETAGHFGWLGALVGLDKAASSALMRARLDWHPIGRGVLADLARMDHARHSAEVEIAAFVQTFRWLG